MVCNLGLINFLDSNMSNNLKNTLLIKFSIAATLQLVSTFTFAAEGKWTQGFGQGNLEYFVDAKKYRLYIGCPTQNGSADSPSSISVSENGNDLKKFELTANGNKYDGPIEATSRVGTNNFLALLDDLKKSDATLVIKGINVTFPKSNAATVLPTFGKKGFDCNLEAGATQASAPTPSAPKQTQPAQTALSAQDKSIIQVIHTSALCAGFYSRYLSGASQASCQRSDMNSQLGCRAIVTDKAFSDVTSSGSSMPPNVKKYIASNKPEFTRSYAKGIDDYRSNQTSQTCFDFFNNLKKKY
jgi:hypothetical protein